MYFVIAVAVLAVSLSLNACSRPYQEAYAMPSPSLQLPHPIKAGLANPPPLPSRRPANASLVKSAPSRSKKFSKATIVRSGNPAPVQNLSSARSQPAPASSQRVLAQPAVAKHYVVVDPVGNCAVVDAKPPDGLEIIGDRSGYHSLEAAKQALKDAKAQCKEMVETGMAPGPRDVDAKFKAAREKSEVNGVENLTQKDIEGLSSEQLKQLRGY